MRYVLLIINTVLNFEVYAFDGWQSWHPGTFNFKKPAYLQPYVKLGNTFYSKIYDILNLNVQKNSINLNLDYPVKYPDPH